MKSGPSFWKGKACVAAFVLLLMMAFLSLYKSNLCPVALTGDAVMPPESPAQFRVEAASPETTMSEEDPLVEPPPEPPPEPPSEDMQRALTEQTVILKAISDDVDSVNRSLGEITEILQEEQRR